MSKNTVNTEMKRNCLVKFHLLALVCGLALQTGSVWAVQSTTTEVRVTGEIIIPPCDVNANSPMEIDFGDVSAIGPTNIGDDAYLQTKTVAITCTWYSGTPHAKLTGTPYQGQSACIATTLNGLCIEFYQGEGRGILMTIGPGTNGNGYPITAGLTGANAASGTFTFSVAPYRDGAALPLPTGSFTATATMSIIYE